MQKLKNHFDTNWLVLAVSVTAIVIVLTHIPQELAPSQLQAGGLDKLLHAAAYGAIALLLVFSIRTLVSPLSALLILLVLLSIGSVDEITQPLVNRQASFADLAANAAGILVVLSLSIACRQQLQRFKTEPVSRLCFTAAVAFVAGVLILPVTLVSSSMFKGPTLQDKQEQAYSFFYRTMHGLFEGGYNPDEGAVSEEALETFNKHGTQLGDKCWLFIYDDWYSQQKQMKGHFFGPAFFPSGDMFEVEIEQVSGRFVLKKFRPGSWESAWQEMMKNSELDVIE